MACKIFAFVDGFVLVVNLLMHLLEVKVGLKYIHKLKGWKTIPELSGLS